MSSRSAVQGFRRRDGKAGEREHSDNAEGYAIDLQGPPFSKNAWLGWTKQRQSSLERDAHVKLL
jgi:hypothetical protein